MPLFARVHTAAAAAAFVQSQRNSSAAASSMVVNGAQNHPYRQPDSMDWHSSRKRACHNVNKKNTAQQAPLPDSKEGVGSQLLCNESLELPRQSQVIKGATFPGKAR